jgi:RimJ/RimL family protein N-acetyltransferase
MTTVGPAVDREIPLPDGRTARLRRATPDDAAAMLEYLGRVGGETPYLTFGAEGPGLAESEERDFLERVGRADNALAIVVLVNDRIVGGLHFEGGRRSRIRHIGEFGISVAQEYAGLGIGRAMLEYLIEWAEGGGVIRKIDLKVRADNAAAIRLYQRMGWRVEGRLTRDTLMDGEFHDCLVMGRAIDPL